jgi:error-prone DNA polymerase
VYVELQRHLHRDEETRNQAAVEIARKLRLPLLATNGVSHATRIERQVLDVFTSIRNHVALEAAGRLLARNSERHLKPGERMARLFADLPEAIAYTPELSSRLEFTLEDLGYEFPKYPVPDGETQDSFLRQRTMEGMISRYGANDEKARRQLERELVLIERLELAGYFLIVWDIVRFCREKNILVQGRGSAANSAVCYSLGITAVDPVGMDLLFERFLSEERHEWPDIDLDLPSGDQRERAIQYVYERYGKLGAAMTANVITYRGRSAAREAGKALSFDLETLDRLTSLVNAWEYKDDDDTLVRHFQDSGFDVEHPHAGPSAPSGAAFGRDGGLQGPTRFRRAARTGDDAGTRRGAVGQGRLRRHGHCQSGFAGARNDGGARRDDRDYSRSLSRRCGSGAATRG